MKHDILAIMNLYEVFGYVQEQAWSSLPKDANNLISALNNRQIKAMMTIYMRDAGKQEPLTLNQLAGILNMKKAAASLLISNLAEKKLVSRTVDTENRRFIRISLAAKGRRLGDAITSQAAVHLTELLGCLTTEEQNDLATTADKIYQRYSEKVKGVR